MTIEVGGGVEFAADLQAGFGGGGGDELDDDLVADQRLAAPVLGDEQEEPMLDLVPLAGSGRQMADGDLQIEFVGPGLKLGLPQPHARAVAAAPSAVITSRLAPGYRAWPMLRHQRRIALTAKLAVSGPTPTLTQPALSAMS